MAVPGGTETAAERRAAFTAQLRRKQAEAVARRLDEEERGQRAAARAESATKSSVVTVTGVRVESVMPFRALTNEPLRERYNNFSAMVDSGFIAVREGGILRAAREGDQRSPEVRNQVNYQRFIAQAVNLRLARMKFDVEIDGKPDVITLAGNTRSRLIRTAAAEGVALANQGIPQLSPAQRAALSPRDRAILAVAEFVLAEREGTLSRNEAGEVDMRDVQRAIDNFARHDGMSFQLNQTLGSTNDNLSGISVPGESSQEQSLSSTEGQSLPAGVYVVSIQQAMILTQSSQADSLARV